MDGKIYIPKPCHENWNKMTPEEKGRHCAVCSKVVKDFTSMQKKEIIDVLKETEGEVCGRINIKEITPTTKKQKIYFLINGWLYRKAIYPIMALLGFTLVTKKAVAQTDYPLKGKVAYNDYHTSNKKINIVVKTKEEKILPDATINIVSGVIHTPEALKTNVFGKTVLELDANNLTGDAIDIEIYAPGYEYKKTTIKLIKDTQTVEIRMEDEIMIMGEMMYVPENEIKPNLVVDTNHRTIKNGIKAANTDITSLENEKIEISKCSILEVTKLPLIPNEIERIESITNEDPVEVTDGIHDQLMEHIVESKFQVYPNPSTDFVNITTTGTENFNLDLFDENGKKLQSVMNGNGRYNLDVSSYSNGMYYMVISVNGKAVETKKIIVTR
jgi:hypothetical protein